MAHSIKISSHNFPFNKSDSNVSFSQSSGRTFFDLINFPQWKQINQNNGSAMTWLPDKCNEFILVVGHLSNEIPQDSQFSSTPDFLSKKWMGEQIPASWHMQRAFPLWSHPYKYIITYHCKFICCSHMLQCHMATGQVWALYLLDFNGQWHERAEKTYITYYIIINI